MADWGKLLGDQRRHEGGEDDDGNQEAYSDHPVEVQANYR
jgi:hypothetical protein